MYVGLCVIALLFALIHGMGYIQGSLGEILFIHTDIKYCDRSGMNMNSVNRHIMVEVLEYNDSHIVASCGFVEGGVLRLVVYRTHYLRVSQCP